MKFDSRTTGIALAASGVAGLLAMRLARRRRERFDFEKAVVVITGGSRGLGLELARLFADEGARIVLLARDEFDLHTARMELRKTGAEVRTWPCDLRIEADIDRVVRDIRQSMGPIEVLINNAGIISVGPFETMGTSAFEEAMDVHFWGPLRLIQRVAPEMRSRRSGRIVNISSIGGLVAVPHLAPYVASKYALTGLSETLTAELARNGIRVTTICPGLMRTGSHVNALFRGQAEKEFAWFASSSGIPLFSTRARRAARRILRACRYGEPRVTITAQARLLHTTDTVAPGVTSSAMALASRMLPEPDGAAGTEKQEQPGWQSGSSAAPSVLTQAADAAIERNNELSKDERRTYEKSSRRDPLGRD